MIRHFFARLLPFAAIVGLRATAETPPAPVSINAELIKDTQAEIQSIAAGVNAKRGAAKIAIDQAIANGTLKETAGNEWLATFNALRPRDGAVVKPEATRVPREGVGPQADPLNSAWEAYVRELEQARVRSALVSERLTVALVQLLYKAAREAQKPADLDAVDGLLAEWMKLGLDERENRAAASSRSACQRIAQALRDGLIAREKNDLGALATALEAGGDSLRNGRADLPFVDSESLFRSFSRRISEPVKKAFVEAHRKLERAVLAEAGNDEIRAALQDYEDKFALMKPISRAAGDTMVNLAVAYRSAAQIAAQLKTERGPQGVGHVSLPPFTWDHHPSAEFQAYIAALQARANEFHLQAGGQQTSEQFKNFEKEREASQRAARERADEIVNHLRAKIGGVRTLPELLAINEEVATLQRSGKLRGDLDPVRRAISAAVAYWRQGASDPAPAFENPHTVGDHLLVNELHALEERAMKAVLSERLNLPQLTQPPLAGKPVFEALGSIYQELARRGDWKAAVPVLRVLAVRETPRGGLQSDRLAALTAYITAQNLETAGQTGEAIKSYLVCARSTADLLPVKEAAERIRSIEAPPLASGKVVELAPHSNSRWMILGASIVAALGTAFWLALRRKERGSPGD